MEPLELKQHHTIWTPELVELSLPLAGIARRCIARLIDQIILISINIAIVFAMFIPLLTQGQAMNRSTLGLFYISCILLSALAEFTYFWAFHNWMNGQTPGKKWLKIRVVSHRGGRINALTALTRGLFNIVDMLLLSGGISALMILVNNKEKRIADFAAGTIVVYEG